MSTPNPGWYADPQQPERLRWWDGRQWSAQSMDDDWNQYPAAPVAAPQYVPQYAQPSYGAKPAAGNTYAVIAMVVSAAYLVIAMTAGVVLLGIVPVLMTVRSFRAKERLAPVAAAATAVAVVVGLALRRY
jgi:hypothetical protein